MTSLEDIGGQIRVARKAKGLTQDGLSAIAGVSRAQIDRLENGRAIEMGFGLVLRLVRAVGLDLTVQTQNHGRPTLDDLVTETIDISS